MYEKTKKCLDTINQIPFVKQNQFVVTICNKQNLSEPLFPLSEIDYFHEEKKNKIVVKIRCSFDNIPKINQMSAKIKKYSPSFLTSNKDKYQITLTLLLPFLNEGASIIYSNCILKNISHPMYFYGKGSDNIATIYFEFKYDNKEFIDVFKENDYKTKYPVKESELIKNNNMVLKHLAIERILENCFKENQITQEGYNKYNKIIDNSNKMLEYALDCAKKHYTEKEDLNSLKRIEEQIENAKMENINKKHTLKTWYSLTNKNNNKKIEN